MIEFKISNKNDLAITKSNKNGSLGGYIVLTADEITEVFEHLEKDKKPNRSRNFFLKTEFIYGVVIGLIIMFSILT